MMIDIRFGGEKMMMNRLLSIFVLVGLMASGVWAIVPGTDVVVAAGGAAPGVSPAYWLTDLVLMNPGENDASVTVSYLPRGGDNSVPQTVTFMVGAGQTLVRPNVVGIDFGQETFGALRIVSDHEIVVNSITKNNPGGADASDRDAFGQGFPGIPVDRAVGLDESTMIGGLAQTDDQRSNFGALDVSGAGSRIRARILDAAGDELGAREYNLRPWEPMQKNATQLVPQGFAAGTLEVTVLQGAVVAYASKVNEGTGDPATLEMFWSCSGGRTSSDGTYYFVTKDAAGGVTGGGSMTLSNGQVTELCGKVIDFDKSPACALWLPYCTETSIPLEDFADGEELTVNYTSGGATIGSITWTISVSVTDNLAVSGAFTGTGSSWTASSDGCNGQFSSMSVDGGVQ